MEKPRLGIFGLTGCAGDQLALLNCEDELLTLFDIVDVKDFVMGSSAVDPEVRIDIALVEGAVLSRGDAGRLRDIRERCDRLVAIGTCAVWGGIAAMDREFDRAQLLEEIYGPMADGFDTEAARPLDAVVQVDARVTGCPVEKDEILGALADLLRGLSPHSPQYPVCVECRSREYGCVLRTRAEMCLGPVTAAGCGARCPAFSVACVGCRGPAPDANFAAVAQLFRERGVEPELVRRRLSTFSPLPAGFNGSKGGPP